jgi:uncharacterized Ntn-hydrolase superfamily protein
MTFSIVAFLPETGELGVAVSTARPAVGNRVPFVRFGVGAAATQAQSNPLLGLRALDLLAEGRPVAEAVAEATSSEGQRELKQLLLVDAAGNPAAFTGEQAHPWCGQRAGDHFAVGGNTLVGPPVIEAMFEAYPKASGDLAERLVATLAAGQAAGGDRRGRQSACLLVHRASPAPYIDLRVDDHSQPVAELQRLLDLVRQTYPVLSLDPAVAAAAPLRVGWPE